MSSTGRKRKHRPSQNHGSKPAPQKNVPEEPHSPEYQFLGHHEAYERNMSGVGNSGGSNDSRPDPLKVLYIQAHEADVVRDSNSKAAAESLEVVEYLSPGSASTPGEQTITRRKIGSALMQWGGGQSSGYSAVDDDDDDLELPPVQSTSQSDIWLDRYDVRLLLDNPRLLATQKMRPASPTGWSDLSSDAEDTFFFTQGELEDFQRDKRRRSLAKNREERLKARMKEDGVDEQVEEEDVWGGSDEEPDDAQNELMRRTAAHLISSNNAAQLEMRIFANRGADKRFAFLRGRWSRAWTLAKATAKLDKSNAEAEAKGAAEKSSVSMGLLAGYGSDDSSDSGNENQDPATRKDAEPKSESKDDATSDHHHISDPVGDAELVREARRKRLKEWTEKRRASKNNAESKF